MSQDELSKNDVLLKALEEALNNYFMDNSVPPEVTAARLIDVSREASRLAEFMKGKVSSLIRDAELTLERTTGSTNEACSYFRHAHYILFTKHEYCPRCGKRLHL